MPPPRRERDLSRLAPLQGHLRVNPDPGGTLGPYMGPTPGQRGDWAGSGYADALNRYVHGSDPQDYMPGVYAGSGLFERLGAWLRGDLKVDPKRVKPDETQSNYTASPLPGFNEGFSARNPIPGGSGYTPISGISALDRFVTTMPLHIGMAGGYSPMPIWARSPMLGNHPLGPDTGGYDPNQHWPDIQGNPPHDPHITPGGEAGRFPDSSWGADDADRLGIIGHLYPPHFGINPQNNYTARPARRHLAL